MYANYLSASLRDSYAAFLQGQDSLDLSEELALLRGMFAEALKEGNVKAVPGLVKEIRHLSQAISRNIENSRLYIPVSMLAFVVQQVNAVIRREVKDDATVNRISNALGAISLPANSRELDSLKRAVQTGRVSAPVTGGLPALDAPPAL